MNKPMIQEELVTYRTKKTSVNLPRKLCLSSVSTMHNFVNGKQGNSFLFRNVLYCNSSVSQNEYISRFYHFRCACHCGFDRYAFILNSISTFFLFNLSYLKTFLTKSGFSVYINHSSLNLASVAIFCHQTFDERPGALRFAEIFNDLKTIIFCEIIILSGLKQFQKF